MRNVLATVPKGNSEMVAAAIRTVFAQPDAEHVPDQLDAIAAMLGRQFPQVETMLLDAVPTAPGELLERRAVVQRGELEVVQVVVVDEQQQRPGGAGLEYDSTVL